MSLISYTGLVTLVEQGVITGVKPEHINAASIDLTLGSHIKVETNPARQPKVSLGKREPLYMETLDISETGYVLQPGEFILASSQEIFNLPNNISAEYKLKSSMARIGLEHLNAGWCDAGWNGSVLTLELKNMTRYHAIELRPGDRIGQIVFFNHKAVPADRSYAAMGSYNGDKMVSGAKPKELECNGR